MIHASKNIPEKIKSISKMAASEELSKNAKIDNDSLPGNKEKLTEAPTLNGSSLPHLRNGSDSELDSIVSNKKSQSRSSIAEEKSEDENSRGKDSDTKSKPNISEENSSVAEEKSKDENSIVKDSDTKSKSNINEENPEKQSSKSESDTEKTSNRENSSSNISKEKPLENGEDHSLKKTSRPDSPSSHVSSDLDLEESLLKDDVHLPNDDQDDFCEEKLLQEIDEEALLKDKSDENSESLSKSTSVSDGIKSHDEETEKLKSRDEETKKLKSRAEETEKLTDSDRQDKEIEKIFKNLSSSIGQNESSSSSSDGSNKGSVESSLSNNNSSAAKSNAKLSDDTSTDAGSNSKVSKRNVPDDRKSNSNSLNSSSNSLLQVNSNSKLSAKRKRPNDKKSNSSDASNSSSDSSLEEISNSKISANKSNSANKKKNSNSLNSSNSSLEPNLNSKISAKGSRSADKSNNNSINSSNSKLSAKRSHPDDKTSNSNLSNKLLKLDDKASKESSDDASKSIDKEKVTTEQTKDKTEPVTKSASKKNALTFSEALKSIAMESKQNQLLSMDQPQPLVPITEISSDVIVPSSESLTVLGAMDTATNTVESNKNRSSSPGATAAADLETEGQGKKRPLAQGNDTSPSSLKPDLKKIRLFRKEDGSKKKDDEITKTMELNKTMTSRLQEEKQFQESKKSTIDTVLEKEGLICIDQEDLQRKTVSEMRKANLGNNKLKRIKRKDLECLVIELFVDKVLYEHQLGQQKDLCKRLEGTLESNRKKAAQFHKEIEDLKKVTQRLQAEHLARKGQVVPPVKVKRSVGIQATPTIIGKGVMHASSFGNIRVLSPTPGSTTSSINNGTNSSISSRSSSAGNQILQPGSVVASQPLTLTNSQNGSGTQVVVVNPPLVVQQAQNVGVGSQILPISSASRVVRTPLTPISSTNLTTASTQITSPTLQSSVSHGNSSSSSSSSTFIDLTDDDEASKSQRTTSLQPGSLVAIQRAPGVINQSSPGQFVTLNPPSSVGQLVLVPATTGQPTTALVVGSVNSTQSISAGVVRSTTISQNTNVRFSSSNVVNTTRVVVAGTTQVNGGSFVAHIPRHPAPLPRAPPQQTSGYSKKLPPVPVLKLSHRDNSIVLSWNMAKTDEHERVASYQLYAYQEGTAPPTPALWKKVGSVKALELPMACTLTQFMPGHVYHFAVRAVDIRSRLGPFSEPRSIRLGK